MITQKIPLPILLTAGLLGLACLLLYLPQHFSRRLVSTAEVPLRRPLAEFPRQLGPYVKVGEEHLTTDIENTLGTKNYIVWIYRDTRVAPGSGPDAVRFQFAYWSGTKQILSTGVHYPELCYAVKTPDVVDSCPTPAQSVKHEELLEVGAVGDVPNGSGGWHGVVPDRHSSNVAVGRGASQ